MQEKLKVLDLFSGIGGFSLGLERAGMETIAFCEIEPFCQKILNKHWPDLPIAEDIRNLTYKNGALYNADRIIYHGEIDVVCGGFPCQPFSVAGRKKGTQDHRDLWPQMFRIIQQAKPTWIIGENVANFTNMAFTRTKIDLENQGYVVQPFIVPACAVNAPHRRDRIWIVANSIADNDTKALKREPAKKDRMETEKQAQYNSSRQSGRAANLEQKHSHKNDQHFDTSDPNNKRCKGSECQAFQGKRVQSWQFKGSYQGWSDGWPVSKSRVCGVDDGIPNRTHRLKSLGNSVVPQIPEIIGHAILNTIIGK